RNQARGHSSDFRAVVEVDAERSGNVTPRGRGRRSALIVRGGWDGHQPEQATNLFTPFLEANGYSVRIEKSPDVYGDAATMQTVDLFVQCNTRATIDARPLEGLRTAIQAGTGMAGWHGGIADSYRNSSDYLHLIGGQFACHP